VELSQPESIWMDGAVRPWAEATVHVWSEVVLRAASVFEGLRGYWSPAESRHYFLHLGPHLARMHRSARLTGIPLELSDERFAGMLSELVAALRYREDVYVRPTAYLRSGRYQADADRLAAGFFMPVFPSPRDPSIRTGIRCLVSSWRRADDETAPPRMKAAANYHNLRLARLEASAHGFDDAILLTGSGKVAETGGAAVFVVRDGVASTPRGTDSVLESITRDSAIALLGELGVPVREREVDRTELYIADEVFLTGTLCEITPVTAVDRFALPAPGPVTSLLQERYLAACRSGREDGRGWLTAGPVLDEPGPPPGGDRT
jgi:branched-chain amino acid aminotransferase